MFQIRKKKSDYGFQNKEIKIEKKILFFLQENTSILNKIPQIKTNTPRGQKKKSKHQRFRKE